MNKFVLFSICFASPVVVATDAAESNATDGFAVTNSTASDLTNQEGGLREGRADLAATNDIQACSSVGWPDGGNCYDFMDCKDHYSGVTVSCTAYSGSTIQCTC